MQSLPARATCRNLISILLLFKQSCEHFLFSCVFEDVRLCPFTFEIPNHPYCASNNRHGRRDVQLLQICTFEGGMVRIIRWLGISYVYRHGMPMAFNVMVSDRANSLSFDFHGRANILSARVTTHLPTMVAAERSCRAHEWSSPRDPQTHNYYIISSMARNSRARCRKRARSERKAKSKISPPTTLRR
jgi:hypothetical protein